MRRVSLPFHFISACIQVCITEVVSAVSVFFRDQGVGIPERELETVFDKFVQSSKTRTGAGGTGLGLSISKEIIEAHHGVIYAENNADGGATFTFTLPYRQSFNKSEQTSCSGLIFPVYVVP